MQELAPDVVERNYAKQPLTRAEIQRMLKAAGGVAAVMNTRHKLVKEHGWKEKPPTQSVFLEQALEEPNLLRRPITVKGSRAVVGKDEQELRKLLG
ncbi:MAG: hypothetical protein KDD82_20080 [Planctomycetes bacterium]|nr:hypothetical protein [Planctomycetota bacterium]